MAWNRGDPNQKPVVKKPAKWHGLVALVAIVVVGVAAIFIFKGDDVSAPSTKYKAPSTIREVTPAAAPTNKVEEVKPKPIDPNARPTKVGEVVNGYVLLPSGRMHKRVGIITNYAAHRVKGPYEIFKHHSENEIAAFLWMKPGQGIVAVPPYNGRFLKDFLASLKEPIVVSKDDSPEQAELKRAVTDAKIELKAAYDRGEDIEQIMMDTRKEMMALSNYKQELKHQLYEFRQQENVTEQDVEDFVAACNKLLEKKGIAPMKLGPISRRKLSLKQQEGE